MLCRSGIWKVALSVNLSLSYPLAVFLTIVPLQTILKK